MFAFWLTCLIEAPWWILGLRAYGAGQRHSISWPMAVGVVLGVNLLTHPLVWWLTASRSLSVWLLAEAGAVFVELLVVAWALRYIRACTPWTSAALLSVGANASSALVGVLYF